MEMNITGNDFLSNQILFQVVILDSDATDLLNSQSKFGFVNLKNQWIVNPLFENLDRNFDKKSYCWAQKDQLFGFIGHSLVSISWISN